MKDKKALSKIIGDFLAGKGFYVVLFICTAVIGVSAWILLSTGMKPGTTETGSVASVIPNSQDVMATTNISPGDFGITDALGKKPVVSPQPSATVKPSAAPSTGKPGSNDGKAASAMAKQPDFIWPVVGDIAVMYSQDELIYNETMSDWRTHPGIDITAMIGSKVMAAADGKVADVFVDDLLGTTVIIDHGNGLKSIYANLAKVPVVKTGDKVAAGAVIGAVGDTALGETSVTAHLHFAITKDNLPADPAHYLPKK